MPRSRTFAFLILTLSLIMSLLILTDAWPYLRGPAPETSEWYWPYLLRPLERWWPTLVSATVVCIFGAWWLARKNDRETIPLLILAALGFCLQLSILFADQPNIGAELVDRTLSKASNGYLATAGEIDDLVDALRRFPELMPTFDNDHARTHPPGFILAHWLTDHGLRLFPELAVVLARPATYWRCTDLWVLARPPATAASLFLWAWMPPLLAALTAPLAFGVARLWHDRRAARLGALLVATLPSLLIFSPTPDQIFAFLSMLSLWVLLTGLRKKSFSLVLLAGLIVSVMTYLSIGNFAWLALLGGFTLLGLIWPEPDKPEPLDWHQARNWLYPFLFAAGGVSIWFINWLGWEVAPWEIIRVGLQQHYELVTSLRRYDWWMAYNLVDFLLFAGPAVVFGLAWRIGIALRNGRKHLGSESRLALLLGLLLLVIHVAGSTRGEVGRLWLVFMPLAAILSGGVWARQRNEPLIPILILASQLILVVSIGLGWRPFFAVILPVERPEFELVKAPEEPLEIEFPTPDGRSVRLMGMDAPNLLPPADDVIEVTLYWQASAATLRPYTVFVHLLDSSGNVLAQQDSWAADGRWPSTCWVENETVVDRREIQIPSVLSPGDQRIVVGLYDPASNTRLTTLDGADSIPLVEFLIE